MQPNRWALLVVALLLVVPPPSQASTRTASGPVNVRALAVAETSQGFKGVPSEVSATIFANGSGQVYVSTRPLAQTDMQGSARLASEVAAATLGVDWHNYDFLVEMSSDSAVIGGPSAGGEMTLALTTALHNLLDPAHPWTLDPHVAGTGTINPDGTIGPVGGVPAKAEAAQAAGITLFLYPAGLDDAPTLVAGPSGPTQIVVNMATHCHDLGITCRPVSSIAEILAAAAHIQFQLPPVASTTTGDYSKTLGPQVTGQVDTLARHVQTLSSAIFSTLTPTGRSVVTSAVASARSSLDQARAALSAQHYYLAATRSFQGEIQASYAENASRFLAESGDQTVQSALQACRNAASAVLSWSSNLTVGGATSLLAVASAQQRAGETASLRDQAVQAYQNALSANDLLTSLYDSSFCVARAGTATWWGNLRDAFGPGPPIPDLASLAADAIEQAQEMVSYAEAVQGGTPLTDPENALQAATNHQAAGRLPAAILEAVNAQTLASVAMQTGGSSLPVPQAVLGAARDSAERAIASARTAGVEPVLSVSLVELAGDQNDTAAALQSLWAARSMAVLGAHPQSSPAFTQEPAVLIGEGAYSAGTYGAVVAMVSLLLLAIAAAAVGFVGLFRRG
ncbi:MAG: S16 family serine protease [Thermoplasmatota archaeon]